MSNPSLAMLSTIRGAFSGNPPSIKTCPSGPVSRKAVTPVWPHVVEVAGNLKRLVGDGPVPSDCGAPLREEKSDECEDGEEEEPTSREPWTHGGLAGVVKKYFVMQSKTEDLVRWSSRWCSSAVPPLAVSAVTVRQGR